MMDERMQAVAALADALETENAALRAMDVPRVVAQFRCKVECANRLDTALAACADRSGDKLAEARIWAPHLRALAEENRRLLERAMFVQGRLIATLARAAPLSRVGYGHDRSPSGSAPPMILAARA